MAHIDDSKRLCWDTRSHWSWFTFTKVNIRLRKYNDDNKRIQNVQLLAVLAVIEDFLVIFKQCGLKKQ